MKYTVNQIKKILLDYLKVTEPELIFGFNQTIYEMTITPNGCSLLASNQRIEVVNVPFDDLFLPNKEILGICLERDWDNVTILRSIPDLSDPEKIIERYVSEKKSFPDQQAWNKAVMDYCISYLRVTYEEKWIRFEPAVQTQPYFVLKDGSYLCLSNIPGFHGIIVEIADNEENAYYYAFEDADIIYECFDRADALRKLQDDIEDSWEKYRREIGQSSECS